MNRNAEYLRPIRWISTAIAIAMAGLALSQAAAAEQAEPSVAQADPDQAVEEVVVIGRYRAAATDIVSERIESEVPMDFLDAEGISRVGDSNVAAALRRVPGVMLVQDQFIYVRGLGERYSSNQLNGAGVPSPDLTRNVLPLDIFPAEIIDALTRSLVFYVQRNKSAKKSMVKLTDEVAKIDKHVKKSSNFVHLMLELFLLKNTKLFRKGAIYGR